MHRLGFQFSNRSGARDSSAPHKLTSAYSQHLHSLCFADLCVAAPSVSGWTQPWRIQKDGPLIPVSVGQAFEFTIRVEFDQAGPFTAARIVDNLPEGLLLGSGPATWTGVNAGRDLNGSKQQAY
jgi:hypothetical protein